MAELKTADNWTLSQLIVAAEKFTFADGKADINETRALIGLIHPFAEKLREIFLYVGFCCCCFFAVVAVAKSICIIFNVDTEINVSHYFAAIASVLVVVFSLRTEINN